MLIRQSLNSEPLTCVKPTNKQKTRETMCYQHRKSCRSVFCGKPFHTCEITQHSRTGWRAQVSGEKGVPGGGKLYQRHETNNEAAPYKHWTQLSPSRAGKLRHRSTQDQPANKGWVGLNTHPSFHELLCDSTPRAEPSMENLRHAAAFCFNPFFAD